jgi:hypothetical protein
MRNRLYFVLPDVHSAREIEKELLLAHVEDRNMHFLAKRGTNLKGLPEATVTQKTDLMHGMGIGLITGAAAGASLGVWLVYHPVFTGLGLGMVLLGGVGGALFGVWVTSMIAISTPNSHLRNFDRTLEQGHVLLMLDLPPKRIEEIRQMILSRHHDAEDHGVEPTIPAFP